jgi:hypothetical protein
VKYQILYGNNIKLYAYLEHMVASFAESPADSALLHQYGLSAKIYGFVSYPIYSLKKHLES